MSIVYIVLGKGFEEMEAVVPCDLLRRAGVEARFVGIGGLDIVGSRGITVHADCTQKDVRWNDGDMIVLPGGLGGVASIRADETVMQTVSDYAQKGKYVAAICAAPTILAQLGLTDGKKATCYPGMENEMGNAEMCDADAVTDGKIITGRAAGAAFAFGLALISALRGAETAEKIAQEVVFR